MTGVGRILMVGFETGSNRRVNSTPRETPPKT
jgi:hypothetical protein